MSHLKSCSFLDSGPLVCHNVILIITITVKKTEMIISVINYLQGK